MRAPTCSSAISSSRSTKTCRFATFTSSKRWPKNICPMRASCRFNSSIRPDKKQEKPPEPKYPQYYEQAEIIAGDFHFMRQFMPDRLDGKIVLTNTVTQANVEELAARGVKTLITTTPDLAGRSFGTNVLEAALLALLGKAWSDVVPADYERLLRRAATQTTRGSPNPRELRSGWTPKSLGIAFGRGGDEKASERPSANRPRPAFGERHRSAGALAMSAP